MLGIINFFVLQWTGFRVAQVTDEEGSHKSWSLLGPTLPISGWFGLPYVGRKTVLWSSGQCLL